MLKLPLLTARELIILLKKLHFELKRQKGSQKFFQHGDGKTTMIPDHPGEKQIEVC